MAAVPDSAGTGKGGRLIDWIDPRFPLTKMWREQVSEYYAPKNFNFWYYFGVALAGGPRQPAGDGDLSDHELQALLGRGVRLGRIHHARRRLGLVDPLHAFDRRFGLLHRDLPAHVPRTALWFAPQAARTPVDIRLPDLPAADGGGLHGVRAALGQYELLGRPGDRFPVQQHPAGGRGARRVDPRRLLHRGRHAQPVLRIARGGAAAGAGVPRGRAPDGPARGRIQQSRRHRDQEAERR